MQCANCPLINPPCADGVGNPRAKIAVVGRNPGKTEARTGEPFTGPSGELMDMTLEELGLDRNDLWITNAVSCHVEDDAGPSKEMYEFCRPRLMEELKQVNPEIILSLGDDATKSLLPGRGNIMSLIGSMHEFKEGGLNSWIIPTFHPAYILRGSFDAYDDMKDAFDRAKRLVSGVTPYPAPLPLEHVHYLNTQKEVEDKLWEFRIKKNTTFAIDTETDFVRDPRRELLLVQLGDEHEAWVFEAKYLIGRGTVAWFRFKELLEEPGRTWIFHNAQFDLQYLLHYWDTIPEQVEDTMMLALCLSEKLQHSGLKRLVNTYLSVPHYETALHGYIKKKTDGYSVIPREVLVPYAGYDVIFTHRLFPVLYERVKQEGNLHLYPLLVESQKLFAQMAYYGVKVDLSYVEELKAEYEPLLERLEKEMQAYAWGKGFRATEVVKNAENWPFLNVKSPKQLLHFLNKYCGLTTNTTDRKFMEKQEGHDFIDMLTRYRKVEHLMSTYIEGIEVEVWPDGRVHPDFPHGTVTGRTTIQHPALQTIPGDDFAREFNVKSIRKLFVVDPGNVFVHFDYSQLEIRVAWHITEDEELGKALQSPDYHRVMASLVYGKPPELITDYERSMSKLVTFGMLYGRQAPSIARQMKIPVPEAKKFLKKFSDQFPKYFGWWESQQTAAVETGVLTTGFGRKRRWSLIPNYETELEIQRQAVNFPVQSTASDICLSSLIKISKVLKKEGWGRPLFGVHDSGELEIKAEAVEQVKATIKQIAEHPFEQTCAIFKVKIGVGSNFAEASND